MRARISVHGGHQGTHGCLEVMRVRAWMHGGRMHASIEVTLCVCVCVRAWMHGGHQGMHGCLEVMRVRARMRGGHQAMHGGHQGMHGSNPGCVCGRPAKIGGEKRKGCIGGGVCMHLDTMCG
eukprot:353150-Chlamydomonas_euryale.AAC.3